MPFARTSFRLTLRVVTACAGLAIVWSVLWPATSEARPRLENICSIQGQHEQKLVGLGLVVGLKGSGDGGKYLPTIRALASALKLMYNPIEGPGELKDGANVALVMIEATVPANGIRRGQKVDCFVNSIGAAKSLRGGRLMMSPLGGQVISDERVMGVASGAVFVEDPQVPTSGKVPLGVTIAEDIVNLFVHNNEFTLLLDSAHSSFQAASEIARVVNADISFEAGGKLVAKAIGPGVVKVNIPDQYADDPVRFVAQVLDVGIDNPHTQARVVINTKAGTVIVTGEVEISPVVISHKNLSVTIGATEGQQAPPTGDPIPGVGFVPLVDQQSRSTPQRLKQLVEALNQLRVPTADVIEIIKDLHRSGKLHAVLILE